MALADPVMWSRLHIRPPKCPKRVFRQGLASYHATLKLWNARVDQFMRLIELWLSRTKECPLIFFFQITTEDEDGPDETLERLVKLLGLTCGVSSQWADVTFYIELSTMKQYTALIPLITGLSIEEVPLLRALSLTIVARDSTAFSSSSGILNSRRLEKLYLSLRGPRWSMARIPTGWEQLTTLALCPESSSGHCSEAQVLRLLRFCPSLVACEIQIARNVQYHAPSTVPDPDAAHLTHRNLRSLILKGTIPSENLARLLDFPSLNSLTLSFEFYPRDQVFERREALVLWLKKFGPQVSRLSFVESGLTNEDLEEVMKCLSSVEDLTLVAIPTNHHGNIEVERALQQIWARRYKVSWLPKLRSLRCISSYNREGKMFTEENMLEFIIGHRAIWGGLKKVNVKFSKPQTMDLEAMLRERGVDFEDFELFASYAARPAYM